MSPSRSLDAAFYAPFVGPLIASELDRRAPPTTGGSERQVFLIARALARRGWSVGIVIYDPSTALPTTVEGVQLIAQRRVRGQDAVRASAFDYARYLQTFARSMRTIDPAVLVQRAAGFETGLVALTAKVRRRPFVYSSTSIADFELERWEGGRLKRALIAAGIRMADVVVVQTVEQQRMHARRSGQPSITIPNIAHVVDGTSWKPEAFLWIGRPRPYKNPLAFVELARGLPEAPFRMVGLGTPGPENQLATQVSEAGSSLTNLELIPAVPHADLGLLFDRAVAVVNTGDFEGMPNALLEGWARGVPALALTHDPDGVIEREQLGRFARGSLPALVEHARALWESRHDQAAAAERCRRYIRQKHSVESVVPLWERALALSRPTSSGMR